VSWLQTKLAYELDWTRLSAQSFFYGANFLGLSPPIICCILLSNSSLAAKAIGRHHCRLIVPDCLAFFFIWGGGGILWGVLVRHQLSAIYHDPPSRVLSQAILNPSLAALLFFFDRIRRKDMGVPLGVVLDLSCPPSQPFFANHHPLTLIKPFRRLSARRRETYDGYRVNVPHFFPLSNAAAALANIRRHGCPEDLS